MTTEAGGDIDPLRELSVDFSTGYVGNVMCETIDDIRTDVDYRLRRITKLMPYLSGLYFSDRQRRMAEAEIFRLQTEIDALLGELHNTLVMAPDLGFPIGALHT